MSINQVAISGFWSSDDLTGTQTRWWEYREGVAFWSSDDLTGTQTEIAAPSYRSGFWSSDDLTGTQTLECYIQMRDKFWSSDDLTGTQTVESEVSEALADLMLMFSTVPIAGESQRAKWLDSLSDSFFRDKAKTTVTSAFTSGDCIIVPSWNGRNIQNIIADSDSFEILEAVGDEITACAFWSSDDLTGTQTYDEACNFTDEFWSSDDLTGTQTSDPYY